MAGLQDFLMEQVKSAVMSHTDQQGTGFDPSALLQQISGAASQGNLNVGTITSMIENHASDQAHTGFDPGPLLQQVQGMLGQHSQAQQPAAAADNTADSQDDGDSSGAEATDSTQTDADQNADSGTEDAGTQQEGGQADETETDDDDDDKK